MLIDVVVRIAHALNLFRILVGNLDAELFLETHDQFDGVELVSAEVVDETSIWRNFIFVDAQLVHYDLFYFLLNVLIGHSFCSSLVNVRQTSVFVDRFLSLLFPVTTN